MKLNKLKKAILFVDVFVAILVVTFMLTTKNFTQIFWATAPEKSLAGAETMGFNFVASPEETKTKAGETVTLTLSVADISAGENGINSIVGFLDYNESLFETVEFQGINSGNQSNGNTNASNSSGWNIEVNRIQGHELYGKFCIYTLQESVKENQDVVKITMKLKSDLAPQTTEVNFKNLVSSDGVYEIAEEERTAVIIIEDAEDDGDQGLEGDGEQGTEGDGNQGSEGDGDQDLEGDEDQGTEGDGNQDSEGDGNQGSEGNGNQGSEGNGNQDSEGNGNQGSEGNGNQNSNSSGNTNNQSNSPQTGDTKILIVLAILILVIIANLLIFCKKSKTKIIATVVTIIVGILSFVIVSNAQNTQNNIQPLTINDKINNISFQENLLNTDKVLVKDSTISAVTPEMTVEDFLNIFNSQIKVTDNETQVTSGELKTGMNVSLLNPTSTDIDKDTIYEVVVAGDINKDGLSNQIELTRIIRNTINNQKWQLNDIEKLAADMNFDGKIDNKDVEASVNYIVYGDYFKYAETVQEDIRNVDAPTIEIVQGQFNEEVNCYIDDVIIRITETDKNASKTRYKIEDENGNSVTLSELVNNSTGNNSSTQYTGLAKFVEIERTNKDENGNVIREILIKKDGIYKISALTDGELGNRSDITYKVIVKGKSDKKYTVTYDYATNGGVSSIDSQITTEDVDVTYNTPVDLSKQGTKQYYKFIGWNTDATATTALSTFTMGIQNETLYAIYEKDIKIELDSTSISMEYGSTQTITATTKNTGNIIWSSSDESIATVSDTGVVTAKKVGTVTITATASTDSTVTATCQVTVTPKTLTISAQADSKVYDGTTNVVNGQIIVNGILNAEDVLINANYAYETATAGASKKINVTNITLSGADANNYKVSETTITTSSDITKAELTASYISETITYGETPALKVTVTGFVNGETAETAEGYKIPTVVNTNTAVGTYTLKPQDGQTTNYTFKYTEGTLEILSKELTSNDVTINLEQDTFTYDGTEKEPKVIIKDGNKTLVEGTDFTVTYDYNKNAGTGIAKITGKDNYSLSVEKTFTINRVILTPQANANNKVYDGTTSATGTITLTGAVNNEDPFVTGDFAFITSTAENSKTVNVTNIKLPDEYAINYDLSTYTLTATADITPAPLIATYVDETITYGETPALVVKVEGFVNNETEATADGYSAPTVSSTETEVGTYELTPANGQATNYTFKYEKGNLTITAKDMSNQNIEVKLAESKVTYNGKEQKVPVTITDNGLTLTEGKDYDVEYKDNKNAGTATVKVTLKGNYSGTKELSFEIEKAKLTATYAGETIEFGQTPQFKVTVDGFVNNETADTAEEYVAPTVTATNLQQGIYTLTPQGGSAKNYDFNYVSGLLVINAKLNVDIQLAQTQFIYDGTAKEPAVIVKDGNTTLVEGTDYDVVYADNINAGTGTATVTLKGNYTGTAVKTFTIAQAQGTGSLSIEGWTYGENAKTPVANSNTNTQVTYQYTGTTNAGTSYSNSVAPTQAGNYTLTATFAANNNFKGFSQTADFVVDKAELIPTATANDKVYDGNTNATGTIMLTGAVNNENPTIETSTFAFENAAAGINKIVNVTNIKLEDVWESNYKLTETDITTTASILSKDLTENEITVSLSETEFTYDGTAKEPTVTIKDGEKTLTQGTDYTVTYTDNVNAGTATIIIDGAGNYSTQIIKTFKINKVKLTPSATVNSKVYDGTTNATGTITLSAAVNNENPIVSVLSIFTFDNATAGTNKTVTVSNIELEEVWKTNYELIQTTLTLTNGEITKAELTATYVGENITYGETPVLDIHVDGFVNGEDETTAAGYKAPTVVITDKDGNEVTVQDLAVSGSPYTVTPKDGDATNYKFKYEDGVLVVNENPAIVKITLTPDSFVYDGTAKQPAITVTDAATGKVLTANTDYTFGYLDNINAGTGIVNITLIGNYTGIATETFEILQADGTASVSIEGWIYGEPSNNPVPYSVTNGTDNVTYLYTGTTNAGVAYSDSVAPTEAGNYKVTATFAETQNYKEVTAEDDFSITKAQVVEPTVKTGLTYTGLSQEGVTSGSNYVLTGDAKATNAGNYTAIATLSNTNNYEWADGTTEPKTYNWSIAKVQLTPSAIANNKVYDGTTIATGTITFAEAVNNEQPTATVNFAFENETVGVDKIVNVTDIVLDPEWTTNYQLRVAQTQTIADITAAKLTATYVSEEINYGDNPELKVEVTGFVNGETEETATRFTIPVVENTNTEPGEYELTPEGGTATNYTFEYVKGTLKINLPTFTITYELNDGELEDGKENPNEYTQKSEDITLNNPTKSGYEFLGWTLTKLDGVAQDSSTPSTTVTIAKGSKGNRVYTANWNLVAPTVEITAENLKVNLFENQTTTFTATVENASNPTYQWYYGENAIEGATASTYSISTTDMNSNNYKGGEYSVAVTNNEPVVTLAETEANTTTAISEKLTQTVKYDEVSSATQMSNFATRVNEQAITFEGDNITQTADVIDLSTVCSASTKNWTPIGTTTNTFKGTFDGNNKQVTNLYIEQKTVVQDELYMLGLFGVTSGSTIKNITVSGNITGIGTTWHTVVGGIVARNINGTIDNCTNNVNIVAISRAGGIAGKSEENSVITNCINNGTITSDTTKTIEEKTKETIDGTTVEVTKTVVASRWIGGIAGVGQGVISNCTNNADIEGNRAGGISGISNNGKTSILNCINNGNITGNQNGGITYTFKGSTEDYKISNCVNTGDLIVIDTYNETNLYGAGIANANDGLIEKCYNIGDIEVTSANYNAASIVGGIFASDGKGSIVRKCYNEGKITAECNHDGDSIHAMCSAGGIAGYIRRNTFIEDCYNRGNITADKLQGSNTNSAGGIVGYISFTELNEVTPGELLPEGEVNTDVNDIKSHMIKNCYSTGDINGTNKGGKSYVGGVLGQYNATSRDINEIVSNTYYLNTSTDKGIDLNGVNTTSIAIPKESSKMKEDAFATLLGDDTWGLVAGVNEDYPVFDWQYLTFDIEYDLTDGELLEGVTNPKYYAESSADIKLNNPVREGYTFTGWTGTGLTEATIDVTIPSGSTGNRKYTATWELAAPTVSVTIENPEVNLFDDVTTTFTANVENASNPTYQWYYNGTAIDGATASAYSISTTEMTESNYKGGEYSVAVTNNETVATLAESGTEQNITTVTSEPQTQTVELTVGTANQLKNLSVRVTDQNIEFINDTIKQTANIDLSSVCGSTKGNWTPIGVYSTDANICREFRGTYDGQDFEVTNLYIDETFTGDRVGLFSYVLGGTVKNLTVRGTVSTSDSSGATGGIIGQITSSTVDNCKNYVNVSGVSTVGGLIGHTHSNGNSTIRNCKNYGSVTLTGSYGGGISGAGYATITDCNNYGEIATTGKQIGGIAGISNKTITNCHNNGKISGNYSGGIIGTTNAGIVITNCSNNAEITGNVVAGICQNNVGSITNSYNTGKITGRLDGVDYSIYAAGIVCSNNGTIEKCYNTADVTSTGTAENAAVFAGGIYACDNLNSVVTKCYNTGNISGNCQHSGDNTNAMCAVGGIAGYIRYNSLVNNCYNTGNVTADKLQGNNSNNAGGIVGFMHANKEGSDSLTINALETPAIINCYSIGTISAENKGGNISGEGGVMGEFRSDYYSISDAISNTYYLETSALKGVDDGNLTNCVESRTSTFMKTDEFVTLLGADNWEIVADKNEGYPVLNWQYSTSTITYDLAGGELPQGVTNPSYYAKDSADITLNNPKREMYVFTGWTGSNGTTPELTVTIPKGSTGNKTYTANWTEAYYYNETSDTYYAKLADATSSSATGSQINVVKNANETARATVSSNKELTLNLNNYTVSYTGTADIFRLYNEGTLNVIGSGKITSTEGYTLRNSGTMNIRLEDDGIVESIGNEITDRAIQNSGTGVLNIYSGKIQTDVIDTAEENTQTYAIVGTEETTINMYGGEIIATATHKNQSGIFSAGNVNISGGTIIANLRGITIKSAGDLNITKGSISSIIDGNTIFFASTGILSITGTEKVDISSNNSNGIYNSPEDGGNGTIIINNSNATISGNSGIYMEIGNIDVVAGIVIGKINYGICSDSTGIITIGKDDSTVSEITPVITGVSYGVNRSVGTLNFYDGLMKGTTAGFSGEVADKPDDYIVDIKTEDEIKVAYLRLLEEYTISYNANGGTGAPEAQTKIEGTNLTLSNTVPTRVGYVFLGWNTSKTATTAEYKPGEIYTEDASAVLYAQWTANTYTVNYYNGTTLLGTSAHTYNTPNVLTKMSTLGGSMSGYTFNGWTTSTTATERTYTDGQSVNNLTTTDGGTVNLYAIWTRPVTFRSGMSSTTTDQQVTQYYNPKGAKSSVTTPTIAEISGYTTEGWSPFTDARAPEVAAGGVATSGASIYYAVYSTDINFIHGIGKTKTTTVKRYRNSNNSIGSIVTPTPDTITSFSTLGWRNDTTVGASENAVGETIESPSTTYYAAYSRTITLKYNANGGTGTVANQTKTQYYNSYGNITSISFTLSANAFTNGDMHFSKWAAGNATGTQYAAGVTYEFSPEVSSTTITQTMYAIWSEFATITFNRGYTNVGGGGGTTPGASGGSGSTAIVPKGYTVYYELNANQAGGTGGSGTARIKFNSTIIDEITATYQYTPKSSSGSFITETDGVLEISGSGGGPTLGETGGQAEGTANAYASIIKILDPYGKECILE